MKMQCNY